MAAQTAIVTGASSGIRRELARLFAADRYNVVLVARQADALNALVAEIARERPVRMRALAIDLSHLDAPRRIEEDLARAGEVADVVVNNAGFGLQGALCGPAEVARIGYDGWKRGKVLVVPGASNQFGVSLVRVSPRRVVRKIVKRLNT